MSPFSVVDVDRATTPYRMSDIGKTFRLRIPMMPQSRLPKVKELCEALGFGSASGRPSIDLTESTQSWRKQYRTSDGVAGKDLLEWRQQMIRHALMKMALDYLELGGYGRRHWPSVRSESLRNVPEYPRDDQQYVNKGT